MASETLAAVRARYRDEALRRGINPRDVDLLLSDLMQQPMSFLITHGDAPADSMALQRLMNRRYAGEPLQYIRGRTEFFSREFLVDDRVLIPRPETEILVETAIDIAPTGGTVVDIGTGSGCIAISLKLARPDLRVVGVDVSMAALAVAAKNRGDADVPLVASDMFEGLRGEFDVVVSNPPYIPAADMSTLQPEVRDHEPRNALTPGPRGTEAIERILHGVEAALILLEIGYGQATAVREIADTRGFVVERFVPDLAGIPRVAVITR